MANRVARTSTAAASRKPSVVWARPDDLAATGHTVSPAEVEFFVDNGFLVKPRMLDADVVDAALDRVWRHMTDRVPLQGAAKWSSTRDDRGAWATPRWAKMPPIPKAGPHLGRQRVVHVGATVKLHDLGGARFIVDLVPTNPAVRAVAESLLGDLRPSTRTRGVYALFPAGPDGAAPRDADALGPHTDQVCQQLNVCAYLADVPPRNGGFTLYPGSHKVMFRAHRHAANWSPLPTFRTAMRQVVDSVAPVEIAGDKGDVIFWHGRAVHSAGIHAGARIRWAVFADFTHQRETLTEAEHRALGQFEWFKDTRLFRHDHEAGGDMWRGWRLGRSRPRGC